MGPQVVFAPSNQQCQAWQPGMAWYPSSAAMGTGQECQLFPCTEGQLTRCLPESAALLEEVSPPPDPPATKSSAAQSASENSAVKVTPAAVRQLACHEEGSR